MEHSRAHTFVNGKKKHGERKHMCSTFSLDRNGSSVLSLKFKHNTKFLAPQPVPLQSTFEFMVDERDLNKVTSQGAALLAYDNYGASEIQ